MTRRIGDRVPMRAVPPGGVPDDAVGKEPSDPKFMRSLARGLQVLESLAMLGPGQSVASVARHTALPRSVVDRCLHTLTQLGYLQPQGRTFIVSARVIRFADAYPSDRSLSALAQPVLEDLRAQVGESCSLGVLDGSDVLYIARASRRSIMTIGLHVGSRLPAWCTSMGRVLLAALDPVAREHSVPPDLHPFTAFTTSDRGALFKILHDVGAAGYAMIDQELELGLRSIAVPVRAASGEVVGALNVGASTIDRSLDALLLEVLPPLQAAASLLGRRIV